MKSYEFFFLMSAIYVAPTLSKSFATGCALVSLVVAFIFYASGM